MRGRPFFRPRSRRPTHRISGRAKPDVTQPLTPFFASISDVATTTLPYRDLKCWRATKGDLLEEGEARRLAEEFGRTLTDRWDE